MKSVQEKISYYQRKIERSQNDNDRIMHCIKKLGKLPITVKHLAETGIAKTLNVPLFDGEVDAAAKRLLQIWKDMVTIEVGPECIPEEHTNSSRDHIKTDDPSGHSKKPNSKRKLVEFDFLNANQNSGESLSVSKKSKTSNGAALDLPQPQIVTNFTPVPLISTVKECVNFSSKPSSAKISPTWTNETFTAAMGARNIKTRVYSGVRTRKLHQAPALTQLCIRVLQKNVDAMEFTGGVPFKLLKPVLESATPDQLFRFEHFNPHLMGDTHGLWEQHCGRKFPTKQRQEMETWREMFIRCTKEQEQRLNSLTLIIKRSHDSFYVCSTKMALVESAKASREVSQKQNQLGTEQKTTSTSAARVASLVNRSNDYNIAEIGDTKVRVLAAIQGTAKKPTASKPRKGPLMQKLRRSINSLGHLKR